MALALFVIGLTVQIINHFFFKNMMFIQSEVYPNLYLVKYPEKDQSILHQVIREKVIEHLKKGFSTGKKLAYQKEDSILFYKYSKAFPFSVFQDEGTAYFLENEEDLGGLVTEELGMYSKYKLAEFDYSNCKVNVTLECGKFSFFNEGNLINKPNRKFNNNDTISDVEEPLDNSVSIAQIKLAFSTKNEVLFLNLFPDSFQEFVSYFGWNEYNDSPSKLYNESNAYIAYFFELISNEKYKNYEKKLINIAKNGKWQADAVNYFQDKFIKYIKKKQRYNLINTLEFKEAKSVLFFLFDGPHPQFDKKFTHSFNNHKMHIIYDLFANEFNVEENKKNPISKDISYYLNNKNYFVRDIDINNDYALDKVVSSIPYQEDELLLFINKDGAYRFALKSTNFSEDGGNQIVDVLAEENGFLIQTTFPDRGLNEANHHITFKNTHWVLTNTLFRVKESNERNSSIYICNIEQELDFSDPDLLDKMKGIPNEDERKKRCSIQ